LDTKHFLTRVFAQSDELVICTHKPDPSGKNPRGFFWNRGSFADIDDAVAAIQRWDNEPASTVYFGVGAFAGHSYTDDNGKQKWYRTQAHATWFKALALDLDIGADKPYATQKEGWTAMVAALKAIGMPKPMVISSGNGIHCYWPLTQKISKAHWEKASTALRIALEENGVEIDTTKIHDPSMVLRPVGTHHKKQQPWKDVRCVADSPDYDAVALFGTLKPWFGKASAVAAKAPATRAGKPKSSILDAVLNSNDVILTAVASRCNQVRALVDSGGVLDAAGRDVPEPLWRASLGLAKHCTDVTEAVVMLAGKHKDFDLNASLNKIDGWHGTGPTTCSKFEQLCAKGCEGCPSRGQITSPAQLSVVTEVAVETEEGEEITLTMPKGYVVQNGQIYREVKTEVTTTDANGVDVAQEVVEFDHVSPYEMHITGVYSDEESGKSAFKMLVKYPMTGWKETAHEITVLASVGKDFSSFLLNRQIYVKNIGQQEKVRGYLMDYLTMVQQQTPTGQDYVSFGWQDDGSFMCGQQLLGGSHDNIDTRLRGPAKSFADLIGAHGSRDEWIRGMDMLNRPGSETIRAAVLLATIGILGPVAGNSTPLISIYSTETTTGKTLALIAANSLIGTPKPLFLNQKDTANAMYKMRGVLNSLPCCIDEMTAAEDKEVADMAYYLSMGREKVSMTKDRDLRDPATWNGPTLVTTNISLHQKFEGAQAGNEPLKIRCLELPQHDRTFVATREDGKSDAYEFFDIMAKNNGWAFPELVEAVLAKGGPEVMWEWAEKSFNKTFNFVFEPQERFYRTALIAAWGTGRIGHALGLFPFDVQGTIQHLIDHVKTTRQFMIDGKVDVFDIVGQFLAEHNDQIVECKEKYGSGVEQVTMPAPERAVARVKIVYDDKNPIMPGSQVAINAEKLRSWLKIKRDGLDRIERELDDNNALLRRRDRITMFKGCPKHAPGQMQCLIVNLNHPRFIDSLTGTTARAQSKITLAVLGAAA
jgi:hypothetical protein